MFALMLSAFLVGVAAVLGIYYAVVRLPGKLHQRRLDARLQEITRGFDEPQDGQAPSSKLVKEYTGGPLPALERLIGSTTRGSELGRWIDQTGVRISISGVIAVSVVLGLLMGVGGVYASRQVLVFPIGFMFGASLPFLLLRYKRRRRLNKFEENFPEALDLISRALKAGHAFATGMKMVADEVPEPVGPEFRKTFDEQNFGLPLKDALDNLTVRVPLLDVRFFATAVMIQRETGGNLSEILENLGHVVRERFKILRQVRVFTAHGRLTGYVLLALPAFLAMALMFINPEHMGLLFNERLGQQMLTAAIIMQIIGYVWIQQVIKIEV